MVAQDQAAQSQLEYWQLYEILFYLNRMLANIAIINTPPNAITITAVNTTLFALAKEYYGDPTQWVIIARANNLVDPMVTQLTTLYIPPWNQQDTGGIL
ncbi:hypothetical protein AQUSIP_12870 [Aquicella siphonis]|uniref:LysM domain-containing protein n=1 Tax=Aquicella siphonis TaxID=254247 RepID=A0A5E4PI27_9COXI|nr:hypothetical protein [Aquicella siphonis]VVC75986.1 hypothetical protein AQUSIP_12870 [Aquicella siphonis]